MNALVHLYSLKSEAKLKEHHACKLLGKAARMFLAVFTPAAISTCSSIQYQTNWVDYTSNHARRNLQPLLEMALRLNP